MAAKAGLFPKYDAKLFIDPLLNLNYREKDIYRYEKEDESKRKWSNFNTYWDESTIDKQFRRYESKRRIDSFKQ